MLSLGVGDTDSVNTESDEEIKKRGGKSIYVAVFLGLFLPPVAYIYVGKTKWAIFNLLTLNYLILGTVIVPIHVYKTINDAQQAVSNDDSTLEESSTDSSDYDVAVSVDTHGLTEVETETDSSDTDIEINNLEYDGVRYTYQYATSDNGQWTAAYGRSLSEDADRFFLLKDDDIQFSDPLERAGTLAGKAAVADDGVSAVLDNLETGELSGKLTVFSATGDKLLTHLFNANVEACSLSSDGRYAAAATLNPDCSTYIFDIEAEEQILRHENSEGNTHELQFEYEEDEYRLYLAPDRNDTPAYAIDLEGAVVWRSAELKRKEELQELMRSADEDDLETALDKLKEAYELASEESERKNVANKLADTHWSLSKELDRNTDEWWHHLEQAKTYYMEVLPWYDGKQGTAKVCRKQGKYHLQQGNDEAALELFQTIADLEEEYDVQLLTDADERRIAKLSKTAD